MAAQKARLDASKADSAAKASMKNLEQLQKSHSDILVKLASPALTAPRTSGLS